MKKNNGRNFTNREYGIMFASGALLAILTPVYLFVLPNQLKDSNAAVVDTQRALKASETKKQKVIKALPDNYKTAESVFKKIADAQMVLLKAHMSQMPGNQQYAQSIKDIDNAKIVIDKYTNAGSGGIGIWGTSGDWVITPETSTLNSGTKIGVSFDVTNKDGVLMYTKIGSYDINTKKVTFSSTYTTKAYNNSQEAGD